MKTDVTEKLFRKVALYVLTRPELMTDALLRQCQCWDDAPDSNLTTGRKALRTGPATYNSLPVEFIDAYTAEAGGVLVPCTGNSDRTGDYTMTGIKG